MKDFTGILLALLVFALIFLCSFMGVYTGKREIRIQAVKAGHGEWIPDDQGLTTFRWKEVAK